MAKNLETQKNYEESAKDTHHDLLDLKSEIREDNDTNYDLLDLKSEIREDKDLIENEELEGLDRKSPEEIDKIIKDNKSNIESAAKEFGVDKYVIAAIIYYEQQHLSPGEDLFDVMFARLHRRKESVGLGQIQIKRAQEVEWEVGKITEKEKSEHFLDWKYQSRVDRLKEPYWNIRYMAAYLKKLQDIRKVKFSEITSRPDILATVYNLGKTDAHSNPKPNEYWKEVAKLIPHMKELLDD